MQRILELQGPPTIGETYLVPCITCFKKPDPNNLDKHIFCASNDSDAEEIHVPLLHCDLHAEPELGISTRPHAHIDFRFMTEGELRIMNSHLESITRGESVPAMTFQKDQMKEITEHPKTCHRHFAGTIPLFSINRFMVVGDYESLQDSMCSRKLDLKCKKCPHKGVPLNSVEVINGIIVCPAHGLSWSATTGEFVRKDS